MRSIKYEINEMNKRLYHFISSIREEATTMDNKALEDNKLIKYIFEVKKQTGKIELSFLYSDIHLTKDEALNRSKIKIKKGDSLQLRGPFPLYDGALADSKIARWEFEKQKVDVDKEEIETYISEQKDKGFKYVYLIMANSYGVCRLISMQSSKKALSDSSVNKMLKKVYYGTGLVKRVNILNGKEKVYER